MSACSEACRSAPAPGWPGLTGLARWLDLGRSVVLALLVLVSGSALAADDGAAQANRQFIQAMQLIRKAGTTYDPAEESRLLTEADRLLEDIVTRFPDTDLAVQLVTNQFVGDFDYFEFRNRVKSLVCNEPASSKCMLFRISGLLPPVETPIASARWDWLSLAVGYHLAGNPARAREIIAPFLAAVRRGAAPQATDRDLFVGRALALTDQIPLALEVTRKIPECGTRVYNLADIALVAKWRGDKEQAAALAEEARAYASAKGCAWENGLVARVLFETGREGEGRTLFLNLVEHQFSRFKDGRGDCCPPELAVAAADMGEVNLALNVLRAVQEENPWTVPAVLGRLCRRGEDAVVQAYAEQIQDVEARTETLAELVDAYLKRGERASAEEMLKQIIRLVGDDGGRRPLMLAYRAKAEHLLYADERWRQTFLQAITVADSASSFVRRDIGGPLVAVLVRIETGQPLLD
jgi:tetratricopeptide (TPR) repeat protein